MLLFFRPDYIDAELDRALYKGVMHVWKDCDLYDTTRALGLHEIIPGRTYELRHRRIGSRQVVYLKRWDGRFLMDEGGTSYEAENYEIRGVII